MRHVVTENQRVLDAVAMLRENGPAAIGALLDASHDSMREDFEISVPELDFAVVTARASGAIGARMTGGGFGGAAIALTPEELVPSVTAAVADAFAAAGYAAPHIFVVRAAAGAGRIPASRNLRRTVSLCSLFRPRRARTRSSATAGSGRVRSGS